MRPPAPHYRRPITVGRGTAMSRLWMASRPGNDAPDADHRHERDERGDLGDNAQQDEHGNLVFYECPIMFDICSDNKMVVSGALSQFRCWLIQASASSRVRK